MGKRVKESPLDEALDKADMSGADLAEQLGVTAPEVSRWRRGSFKPLPATQCRIAELLGVSVESLWPTEGES